MSNPPCPEISGTSGALVDQHRAKEFGQEEQTKERERKREGGRRREQKELNCRKVETILNKVFKCLFKGKSGYVFSFKKKKTLKRE